MTTYPDLESMPLKREDLPVPDSPADSVPLVPCPDDCTFCQSPETD